MQRTRTLCRWAMRMLIIPSFFSRHFRHINKKKKIHFPLMSYFFHFQQNSHTTCQWQEPSKTFFHIEKFELV